MEKEALELPQLKPANSHSIYRVPESLLPEVKPLSNQGFLRGVSNGEFLGCYVISKEDPELLLPLSAKEVGNNGKGGLRLFTGKRVNLAKNFDWLRYWNNGDKNVPLTCNISNAPLDNIVRKRPKGVVIEATDIEQHHMKATNGKSEHKGGYDPSKLMQLNLRQNPKQFIDAIMVTMTLSATEHKIIHKEQNLTIASYFTHELPWGIRCAVNYNQFCKDLKKETGLVIPYNYSQFVQLLK